MALDSPVPLFNLWLPKPPEVFSLDLDLDLDHPGLVTPAWLRDEQTSYFYPSDLYNSSTLDLGLLRKDVCVSDLFLQEIQERLRIIQLCATDQHFADFVQQTQV